jgi:hypothetical protein
MHVELAPPLAIERRVDPSEDRALDLAERLELRGPQVIAKLVLKVFAVGLQEDGPEVPLGRA